MSIKDWVETLQNFLNKYYVFILGVLICLVGFNNYLNILVAIILLIILLFVDFQKFIFFYIYLDIFSEVFDSNQIFNLILRTYQLYLLIKIISKVFKKDASFLKKMFMKYYKQLWMIVVLLVSLILYERNILTILSFVFFHIPMLSLFCIKIKDKKFKHNFLQFISWSGLIVMIWGVVHNVYGITYMGNAIMTTRISYVSENPNISGYILLLSTISSFYFIPNRKYLTIIIILSLGVLSTVSISAIAILVLFLLFYLLKQKYLKIRDIIIFVIIILICIFFMPFPIFVDIRNRILEIILPFISNKYASDTSSGMARLAIYQVYIEQFFRFPLINILFGGLDITKGYLLDHFIEAYNVLNSHCFIIDLLYGNGIIFLSFFLMSMFFNLKKNLREHKDYILFGLKMAIILIASVTKVYPSILFYLLIVI